MIKNVEWGAVAYLSQSKYGKYGNSDYTGKEKEVFQNKSKDYVTGSSNGTPSQSTYSEFQCVYDDLIDRGEGKGSCGGGASTTGNITGIYDMSGGNCENVMGNYNNKLGYSTSFESFFNDESNSKYYDKYTTTDLNTACNGSVCLGHALSETQGWYNDQALFASSDGRPWVDRGGEHDVEPSGIFFISDESGGNMTEALRVVFAPISQ